MAESDHFDWLVEARSDNQRILRRLHRFAERNRTSFLAGQSLTRAAHSLLVGAAFSLWRAAFLSDAKRNWPSIVEDAEKLLERLIRDNAIAYPQDRDTREWMAGYYLNNAMWRVVAACEEMQSRKLCLEKPSSVEDLKTLADRGIRLESPKELWVACHVALSDLLDTLEQFSEGV